MADIEDRLIAHGRMLQNKGKTHNKTAAQRRLKKDGPVVKKDYERIQKGFRDVKKISDFMPKKFVHDLSETVLDKVVLNTPDIDDAKEGWKLKIVDKNEILVMNETEEIKFIEYGSHSHVIEPKDESGVLAFEPTPGRLIFVKHVKHPGTAPQWPMRVTVQKVADTYMVDAEKIIKQMRAEW